MKKIFIAASVLIFIGLALFIFALISVGFDFGKLGGEKYELKEYSVAENFNRINITSSEADIVLSCDENATKVSCFESEKVKYNVFVENGELKITVDDARKWYDDFFVFGSKQRITLYLSQREFERVKIDCKTGDAHIPDAFRFGDAEITTSTGDIFFGATLIGNAKFTATTGGITLNSVTASGVDVSVSTGKIVVENSCFEENIIAKASTGKSKFAGVRCKNLTVSASTGNVTLSDTIASGKLEITVSTGDVRFEKCDAGEIKIKTSTGDVRGSLLTEKIFDAHAQTGKVSVPQSSSGGKCEISTSTGDIKITIPAENNTNPLLTAYFAFFSASSRAMN